MLAEFRIKHKKQKAIVLTALVAALSILLSVWYSTAEYTTQLDGYAKYEPALFNTVLLGDLTFKNGQTEYIETEADGRLHQSIFVDTTMEFGALDGQEGKLTSNERRLRPGAMVAIPFTVTNGTTLQGETDEDGNPLESNLAGTDIVYSLSLITTVNMPLEYDVYEYTTYEQLDYMQKKSESDSYNYEHYISETKTLDSDTVSTNWGRKLDMAGGGKTYSPEIGYSREYEVRPSTYKENGTETENKFLLQKDSTGETIAIKRYMLVICWPDLAEGDVSGTSSATKVLRDTKYMKEIDILEVRLEVESWVDNAGSTNTPTDNDAGKPILRIGSQAIADETYYQLPTTGPVTAEHIYGRSTVPFSAMRELSSEGLVTTSYLDFMVTNKAEHFTYTYDATTSTYLSSNITALSGGQIAMAVPVKSTMGTTNDYTVAENFTYAIEYQGKTYTGTLTDSSVTTAVWGKNEDSSQALTTPYADNVKHAYRVMEFKDAQGNLLTLADFTSATAEERQLRLLVTATENAAQSNINYDNKDNFKLFVYQAAQGDQGE